MKKKRTTHILRITGVALFLMPMLLWAGSAAQARQPFADRRPEAGVAGNDLQMDKERARRLLGEMTEQEQIDFFLQAPDSLKEEVFGGLSASARVRVFPKLDNAMKRRLVLDLTEEEKQQLLLGEAAVPADVSEEREPVLPPLKTGAEEPSLEPPAPSDIERILSGHFPSTITRELRQFGYDFFEKEISTFAPIDNVPVGPDYVVGPGDGFTIQLWGKAERGYEVTVGRDGRISLPEIGSVNVSGMTFEEMKRTLYAEFRRFYTGFEMSVTMRDLRTVTVFIVGAAENPGTYAVSSLSTIITALYAAGGPSKNGSLRNVKLLRDGELVQVLDVYDFLVSGSKKDDLRIQAGDSIFVPVLGPVVGVAGNVRRPAIYEMKGGETIGDVLELSGGIMPTGRLQHVVIERIDSNQTRVVRSFNLDPQAGQADRNLSMALQDGDVIKIRPVHDEFRQVVYLEGHVKYPGEFELKEGMSLLDLIPSYDALLPEPYLDRAEIVRRVPPDLHLETIQFDLGGLLSGNEGQDLELQELDRVVVYGAWDKRDRPTVRINGEVRSGGEYRLHTGMTVKDLIFQAGNLTRKAFEERATLTRVIPSEEGTETVKIEFSPRKAMTGDPQENLALRMDDQVFIREIPKYTTALRRKVTLEGEFLFPGEYTFSEGERISSIIERAGGLTAEAYPFAATFQRESAKNLQQARMKDYVDQLEEDVLTMSTQAGELADSKEEAALFAQSLAAKKQLLAKLRQTKPTGRVVINLPEVMELPSSTYNFEVRPGDRLVVAKRPDTVHVLGEVYNPTALLYEGEKSVGYYLNQVGGITESANDDQIYVVKANGSVISRSQGAYFGLASWDGDRKRWSLGGFDSMGLDPGDTIIVPKRVVKYPWLPFVKGVTEIMYQIAVSAGVLVAVL